MSTTVEGFGTSALTSPRAVKTGRAPGLASMVADTGGTMTTPRWVLLAALALASCTSDDTDDKETDTELTDTELTSETDTDAMSDTDTMSDTDETDTEPPFSWPATSEDYTWSGVTFVKRWILPADAGDCCRDFGAISRDNITMGTDKVDNALIGILNAFGGALAEPPQDAIDGTVESGFFLKLFDHVGLPDADGQYRVAVFDAVYDEPDGTTWAEAEQGLGTFLVLPESFEGQTGTPSAVLDPVYLLDGAMSTTGGTFELEVPFGAAPLSLTVQDLTLDAELTISPTGVAAVNGTLSGIVTRDDVFVAMNVLVDATCGCLGLTGQLFTQAPGGSWQGDCQRGAAALCPAEEEVICRNLGGNDLFQGELCATLPGVLALIADIDMNGDTSAYEGLSVGLQWEGVPATVNGIFDPDL